jgi:hypothetical protein
MGESAFLLPSVYNINIHDTYCMYCIVSEFYSKLNNTDKLILQQKYYILQKLLTKHHLEQKTLSLLLV